MVINPQKQEGQEGEKNPSGHDVELELYSTYYDLVKLGLKPLEVRKKKIAETGDIIKFKPANSHKDECLYCVVLDTYEKYAGDMTTYELKNAWISVDWLIAYLDGRLQDKVHLYDIERVDK